MWEPGLPGGLTVSVTQVSWFPDVASCHTELPLIFFCVVAHVGDVALWRVSVWGTCSSQFAETRLLASTCDNLSWYNLQE